MLHHIVPPSSGLRLYNITGIQEVININAAIDLVILLNNIKKGTYQNKKCVNTDGVRYSGFLRSGRLKLICCFPEKEHVSPHRKQCFFF